MGRPIIDTDVLIAGLGPAGATAAAAAARSGLRVIAIDRRAVAGTPVQCAEFVPAMIGMEIADLGASRIQPIGMMRTYVEAAEPEQTPDFRGQMIDRAEFDRHLVCLAEAAGADCRFGTPLRGFDPDGTAIIGDGDRIRAGVIIGADGPRSRVGAAIGAVNDEIVESRQITVGLKAPYEATDIFLRADMPGGYGWLFPRGGDCNIGLGVTAEHKAELKPLLQSLHAELVAKGRVGSIVLRLTGGPIPVGGLVGPTGRLGRTPVLLAGDAAGLVNPVTGAGIPAAVISGRMAGEAAAALIGGDTAAADDYAEEIAAIFGPSLRLALRRRQALMDLYEAQADPTIRDLRRGWIAFPEYWNRDDVAQNVPPPSRTPEATRTP
jgi:geranylgeranyl reductase family protein